ncbi:Nitrate/nitrite response regulator protein [Marinobacterium lacunae]|uniref:Nitrate/nitrite response regulator protein n=1 Tax=Marinobacterium lacunae TaxID=1232683 RepID=A0A081FTF4_9GAMM|nr:Nitrate/nitrite response regulator protein [Marinobacterium lacunae]
MEDYEPSRALLQMALQRAFGEVQVDAAVSLEQANGYLDHQRYQLAILDLNLPDGSGIEILARIRREAQSTVCVVATVADDDASLFESLRGGAQGYLLKTDSPVELAAGLKGVLDGHLPLSPAMASKVVSYFNGLGPALKPVDAHLTAREEQVLKLVAQGASRKAIARELDISVYTANDHIKSIYRKLKISSRVEATRIALERGLS